MRKGLCNVALVMACGLAGPAVAQTVVNGDFETGDLSGWTVVNTTNGAGAPGTVVMVDIDAAGPLGISNAARFAVYQTVSGTGQQGIEMTQPVTLQAGTPYVIEFDWLVYRDVNVSNGEGGVFAIIVNGVELASEAAGFILGLTPYPGDLSVEYTPTTSGPHQVGVRITRPFTNAGPLYQYVDNFTVGGGGPAPCYANCDQSTTAPVLNVQDFTCFLTRYAAGESYANCDQSTVAPVLNVQDFTCFLQAYAAGCP